MRKARASLWMIAAACVTTATLLTLPYTPKIPVQTAIIRRGDLELTTLLEGAVTYAWQQPLLAPTDGRVSEVYAAKGQSVREGELLFRMDSSAEEQALSAVENALTAQQAVLRAASAASEAVAAAGMQSLLSLESKRQEAIALIEAKQLRAERSGAVCGVYAAPGDYVQRGALLGKVCGNDRTISALCRAADAESVATGALARLSLPSGKGLGLATLTGFGAPQLNEATGQMTQALTLAPRSAEALSELEIGERVIVELLREAHEGVPLAPCEAVGEGDALWVVQSGKAKRVPIDPSLRSENDLCVPEELLNCAVILNPDQYALYADCAVKAAKAR